MKSFARYIVLLAMFLCMTTIKSRASHASGIDIRYVYNGSNYTVYVNLYSVCQTNTIEFDTVQSVTFSSQLLSQQFTRNLKRDTVYQFKPSCNGDSTSCDNLSALIMGYKVYSYSDTVSFPSISSDWILSTISGGRFTSNISSGSLYAQTSLDNHRPNSNAVVNISPLYYLTTNDTFKCILNYSDVDNDSISIEFTTPRTLNNVNATYYPGSSVSDPFSSGSFCKIENNRMSIFSPISSIASLAIIIHEYRSGVEESNRIHEFSALEYPVSYYKGPKHNTIPFPANNATLSVTTCPGKANSIMLSFLDSTATDIVDVDVITPNLPGWTFNKTVTRGAGRANVNLSWIAPTALSTLRQFFITLRAKDNECPNNTVDYVLAVKTDSCIADSVWPGDANSDNVVNLYDPLAVAIAYTNTGASRVNPNILWQPQACSSWGNVFQIDNVDMKHADCNGNGTADNIDLIAISNNYGKNHGVKKNPPVSIAGATNATLFLDTTGIIFEAGKTLQIPIVLGTASSPIDKIYGIATSINADTLTLASPVSINPTGSWLPVGSSTMVNFSKNNTSNNLDWVQARTTHTNISGYGTIGTLTIDIPATTADNTPLKIDFENTRIIDSIGRDITGGNVKGINTTVKNKLGIGNTNTTITQATIVPNPSSKSAKLILKLRQNTICKVAVTDITGRTVWTSQSNGSDTIVLPAQDLQSGIYFVKLMVGNESTMLKWVKE